MWARKLQPPSGIHLGPTAPHDPRPSTHHVQDRLSPLYSCLLSGTSVTCEPIFPPPLWPPPCSCCPRKSDSRCQQNGGSLEWLRTPNLPVPVLPVPGSALATGRWLQSRCKVTAVPVTCHDSLLGHSSPGPLPCGYTHIFMDVPTQAERVTPRFRVTPSLPHHTHRCSQSVREPVALAGEQSTRKRPGAS